MQLQNLVFSQVTLAATQVPPGAFQISIDDLKKQVQDGRIQAGPNGLQPKLGNNQVPAQTPATNVPKGTFHIH